MKTIYSYNCYRSYLRDYYREKKKSSFSYSRFSEIAEIKSPNLLKLVIEGKKNLSPSMIHRFAYALDLNYEEIDYFTSLVFYDQSDYPKEQNFHKNKLKQIKSSKSPTHRPRSLSKLLSYWYYPAILIALDGKAVDGNLQKIADYLDLPLNTINQTVKMLFELGAIEERKGKYRLSNINLDFKDRKKMFKAHRDFLLNQATRSLEVLKKAPKKSHYFSQTFSIGKEDLDFCVSKIESFLDDISKLSDQSPREELIQINSHIYKLGTGTLPQS